MERRAGFERSFRGIADWKGKGGAACQEMGLFVVEHVIDAWVGEHKIRGEATEKIDGFAVGPVVKDHIDVALFEAVVGCADHFCAFCGLAAADAGDRGGREGG